MPRFDLTTIGEGQLRYSTKSGQALEQVRQMDVFVSGTEANVAATLSRLGWHCAWQSALPNNPLGWRVKNEYQMAGINLSDVIWTDGRLATYYVDYAVPPRATRVYFDRQNSCFSQLTAADINWDALLDTKLIHLSGITLALTENLAVLLHTVVEKAKEAGIAVSFDMNYRQGLWSPEAAQQRAKSLIQDLTLFFCSKTDASTIFNSRHQKPEHIIEDLSKFTKARYIIMSMGTEGLMGWDRLKGSFTHVLARDVTIIDRIGAGDGMVAGVLHGYLQGDFHKGLHYGAVCAALAMSQYGDQPSLNMKELEYLLSTTDTSIIR